MNLGSAEKLSMEELRQKNLPSQAQQIPQSQAHLQPIVIQCALPEAAEQLDQSMESLEWYAKRQVELLQEIKSNSPSRAQLERVEKHLKQIESQLSQVGKENEKPSLLSKIKLLSLPSISWCPEMIIFPLLLLTLLLGWCIWEKFLNGISQLPL